MTVLRVLLCYLPTFLLGTTFPFFLRHTRSRCPACEPYPSEDCWLPAANIRTPTPHPSLPPSGTFGLVRPLGIAVNQPGPANCRGEVGNKWRSLTWGLPARLAPESLRNSGDTAPGLSPEKRGWRRLRVASGSSGTFRYEPESGRPNGRVFLIDAVLVIPEGEAQRRQGTLIPEEFHYISRVFRVSLPCSLLANQSTPETFSFHA